MNHGCDNTKIINETDLVFIHFAQLADFGSATHAIVITPISFLPSTCIYAKYDIFLSIRTYKTVEQIKWQYKFESSLPTRGKLSTRFPGSRTRKQLSYDSYEGFTLIIFIINCTIFFQRESQPSPSCVIIELNN